MPCIAPCVRNRKSRSAGETRFRTTKFAVVIARVQTKYPIPSLVITSRICFLELLLRPTFDFNKDIFWREKHSPYIHSFIARAYCTDLIIRRQSAKLSQKTRIPNAIFKLSLAISKRHPFETLKSSELTPRICRNTE